MSHWEYKHCRAERQHEKADEQEVGKWGAPDIGGVAPTGKLTVNVGGG